MSVDTTVWPVVRLGALLRPISRQQPVEPGRDYPLLGVRWYCDGARLHSTVDGSTLQTPSLNRVRSGDVTYNKMWVTKGAFAVLDDHFDGLWATSEYPTFRADETALDTGYLWYVMQTDAFQAEAAGLCRGSTSRARLNPEDFLRVEVRRPPLAEQKKIAAILASVDDAIRATQRVVDQIRQVKVGLLQDLLTRGLPGHTRFKPTLVGTIPESWQVCTLDSLVVKPICYGVLKPGPHVPGGIPVVRIQDYTDGTLHAERVSCSSPEVVAPFWRSTLSEHDILISIRGTAGRLTVIPAALTGANISRDSARICLRDSADVPFVYTYLESAMAQDFVLGEMRGLAVRGINIGDLRELPLPWPAPRERAGIVERVTTVQTALRSAVGECSNLQRSKSALLQDLLSGKVRVTP